MNADGSERVACDLGQPTGFGPLGAVDPSWSPDGSTIAFVQWDDDSRSTDVYTIKPDGSGLINLTHSPFTETPSTGVPCRRRVFSGPHKRHVESEGRVEPKPFEGLPATMSWTRSPAATASLRATASTSCWRAQATIACGWGQGRTTWPLVRTERMFSTARTAATGCSEATATIVCWAAADRTSCKDRAVRMCSWGSRCRSARGWPRRRPDHPRVWVETRPFSETRGNDTIFLRDGERDVVHCGKGRDHVQADRIDRVFRDCERVLRR